MPQIALMAAGRMTESWIARADYLGRQIRYIYSIDVRFATRWSRSLKTGSPAETWRGLEECDALFVRVPDERLDDVLHSLRRSMIQARGRHLILCDSTFNSKALDLLRPFGFRVASLTWLDGFEDRRFLAEGDPAALKFLRRIFHTNHRRLHEVSTPSRELFLAALDLAHLTFPLLAASHELLRRVDVSAEQALQITERIAMRNSRGFAKAGKKGWNGPAFQGSIDEVAKRVAKVRQSNSAHANLLAENVRLSKAFLSGAGPELIPDLSSRVRVAPPRAAAAAAAAS